MNAYSRFTLTLLSTALLLPNDVSCQVPVSPAASSQANYQSEPQQLTDIEASVFYKALKPYGDWVEHKTYGQVWYPRDVPKNWRPYSNGHWAHTREYGWLWVSNEPWGWAVFHYGRWSWDAWYGWIWIPGHTWAPAWVFWRSGGGYTAWAAMPPNAVWHPNVGMNIQYVDYNRDIHQDSWVAVCNDSITYSDTATKCYPAASNDTIINQTKIIQQSNIVQHNNSIHKQVSVLHNTIANRPPITVSNAPIVPITIATNVPVDTATNANTVTAIVVQPEIPEPTPEQIAQEERLAKTLAEQNATVAKTAASDKQPREAGRFTGTPKPEETRVAHLNTPTILAPDASQKTEVIPVPATPANDQAQQQAELQAVLQAAKQTQQQVEKQAADQAQQQAELQAVLQSAKQTQQQVEKQAAEQTRQQAELQAVLQTAKQTQQQAEQQAAEQAAKLAQQQAEQQAAEQAVKLAQQQAERQAAEQAAKLTQQQAEAAKKKAECGVAGQMDCKAEEVKLIAASPRDHTKQDFYSPFINTLGNRVSINPELTEWSGRKNRKLSNLGFDKHTTND